MSIMRPLVSGSPRPGKLDLVLIALLAASSFMGVMTVIGVVYTCAWLFGK